MEKSVQPVFNQQMNFDGRYKCQCGGCEAESVYVMEWYVILKPMIPENIQREMGVCDDMTHLLKIAEKAGRLPDKLVHPDTLQEFPDVLEDARIITSVRRNYPIADIK
jgi:hypothetical protein